MGAHQSQVLEREEALQKKRVSFDENVEVLYFEWPPQDAVANGLEDSVRRSLGDHGTLQTTSDIVSNRNVKLQAELTSAQRRPAHTKRSSHPAPAAQFLFSHPRMF
jgi:hypothetical protein